MPPQGIKDTTTGEYAGGIYWPFPNRAISVDEARSLVTRISSHAGINPAPRIECVGSDPGGNIAGEYNPSTNTITLFKRGLQLYVLLHELAHALAHASDAYHPESDTSTHGTAWQSAWRKVVDAYQRCCAGG